MKTINKIMVIGFFFLALVYGFFAKLLSAKNTKTTNKFLAVGIIFIGIVATTIACTSTKKTVPDETSTAVAEVAQEFILEKSGAQLWGETCNRCHLAPSPADYNDTDWETISLHMRVRANLTEKEITKIEEFLKSAN